MTSTAPNTTDFTSAGAEILLRAARYVKQILASADFEDPQNTLGIKPVSNLSELCAPAIDASAQHELLIKEMDQAVGANLHDEPLLESIARLYTASILKTILQANEWKAAREELLKVPIIVSAHLGVIVTERYLIQAHEILVNDMAEAQGHRPLETIIAQANDSARIVTKEIADNVFVPSLH